jgi:hypothetical protein
LGNWSRNMTEKVKGAVPWPNRSEGAEAIVSDEPQAPRGAGSSLPSGTAAAPQLENPPANAPWYRRLWR